MHGHPKNQASMPGGLVVFSYGLHTSELLVPNLCISHLEDDFYTALFYECIPFLILLMVIKLHTVKEKKLNG